VKNQLRGHLSPDWYSDCEAAAERPASVAGNSATGTGTLLTHPLMLEQFFWNATCSLIYGRHCSVTNNNTINNPTALIIFAQATDISTML